MTGIKAKQMSFVAAHSVHAAAVCYSVVKITR